LLIGIRYGLAQRDPIKRCLLYVLIFVLKIKTETPGEDKIILLFTLQSFSDKKIQKETTSETFCKNQIQSNLS